MAGWSFWSISSMVDTISIQGRGRAIQTMKSTWHIGSSRARTYLHYVGGHVPTLLFVLYDSKIKKLIIMPCIVLKSRFFQSTAQGFKFQSLLRVCEGISWNESHWICAASLHIGRASNHGHSLRGSCPDTWRDRQVHCIRSVQSTPPQATLVPGPDRAIFTASSRILQLERRYWNPFKEPCCFGLT